MTQVPDRKPRAVRYLIPLVALGAFLLTEVFTRRQPKPPVARPRAAAGAQKKPNSVKKRSEPQQARTNGSAQPTR